MGRRRIPIAPIEPGLRRRVTMTKRSVGLIRKALELGILTGGEAQVLLVIQSTKNGRKPLLLTTFSQSPEEFLHNTVSHPQVVKLSPADYVACSKCRYVLPSPNSSVDSPPPSVKK